MPKVESYQKVKKGPGVGQRPANSKSLGAGCADVQTNAMLASANGRTIIVP